MKLAKHLILFICLFSTVSATPSDSSPPYPIRWKKQEFTKEQLIKHIAKEQQEATKLEKEGITRAAVPSEKLLKSIIEAYEEGDKIIYYDNGLWNKGMGRLGYALIRKDKVIVNRLLAMN
ncbi:hypothetical protein SAMN02745181_3745 [Rubritalea squalenifaciens DSM 18772]|uniref:Uncharacterized protein n=1 Tax=Rubritalea squalenifaciens DSM 18772 TaxID=1123071 RepID=A0A1M6S7X6_9BACT|nr:hypothetical protein [Rubritalea squalenifaciens]SHK40771.1 hypothetical protein SAMN02745181_3745 [Rubritalea squalenifaciens DSM 18772]